MANVSLDKDMFFRRMKRLYAAWKVSVPEIACLLVPASRIVTYSYTIFCFRQDGEVGTDDSFSKMDCLVSAVGTDEDIVYSKSIALQVHVFQNHQILPEDSHCYKYLVIKIHMLIALRLNVYHPLCIL